MLVWKERRWKGNIENQVPYITSQSISFEIKQEEVKKTDVDALDHMKCCSYNKEERSQSFNGIHRNNYATIYSF